MRSLRRKTRQRCGASSGGRSRQQRRSNCAWIGLRTTREIERFIVRLAASSGRRSGMRRATLIATCRRREAGGRYRGTIAKQLIHLGEALRAGCEWYDLEIESASRCPAELLDVLLGEGRQICSAHFFQRAPKNLKRVVASLSSVKPDAIKIAAQCESLTEARRVLAIARGRRDTIAVPMSDVALPMRVLALREGGAFVYAPVENATAPGQVTLSDMVNLYRAGRITRRTRVYGVIGNPIGHSLSPQLQNARLSSARNRCSVFAVSGARLEGLLQFDRSAANERIQRHAAAQRSDSSLSR